MEEVNREACAALFDLDGVVVDTESQYSRFWTGIGKRYFPDNSEFSDNIKGCTLERILKDYFGQDKRQSDEVVEELNAWERHMNYNFIAGFERFIFSLREAGVRTAVVTSSNHNKMQNLYRSQPQLPTWFDRILTAEDFSESKPSPDGYLKAAAALGVPIERCVVFEDSCNGLISGRRAGMKVVGLSTTLPRAEVVRMSDVCINDFEEFGLDSFRRLLYKSEL